MRRWSALLLAVCIAWLGTACAGANAPRNDAGSIADLVLRVGEDVGTEVETFPGELPPGLDAALDASNAKEQAALPKPPQSTLRGSGRVARPDGTITFFVMYEVKSAEQAVAAAMHDLVNTTPWQVVGGQSNEGVSAFNFSSTRSDSVTGTVVIQPLPTTDHFDVLVSRDGKNKTLSIRRHAFVPVLGAELQVKDAALVVSRVIPGEAAISGLHEGDRILKIAGKAVKDTASMQATLRNLDSGNAVRTSVIYITRATPELPLQAGFSTPQPRPLPADFPARYLLLNGETPIAVRWTTGGSGATYELTLITHESPTNTVNAYRQIFGQQKLQITSDTAQGFATTLEFTGADQAVAGSLNIDVFDQDDSYTVVSAQLRTTRAASPAVPGSTATPRPSGTAAPRP